MKIIWNKVTWYSKLVAVIIFVLTFCAGFYLGEQKGALDNVNFTDQQYVGFTI